MSIFFGSFGPSAPKSRIWALFRPPSLQTSGNCAGRLHKACGGLWTTKNLFICARKREKGVRISFKFLRRRPRRRRKMPQPTLGPPNAMRQAGQHRLPGGRDAEGQGVLGLGSLEGSRFESHTTLLVATHILCYESDGQKNLGESPPRKMNLSGKVPPRGARVGAGRLLGVFRGKFRFFATFLAKVKKPPPPRLEPVTSPSFA